MTSLDGQVAWITGGGSGIGRAAAMALAAAGATVLLSGRDADRLHGAIAQAPTDWRARLHALPVDVADAAAVAGAAAQLLQRHGRIDVLVNSAGLNVPGRRWDQVDSATFDHVLSVNLSGATHGTLAVLGAMRAQRSGTVVNVSSFVGWHLGGLTGPAYTASKAGLIALTHSFNIEQGPHGLRATVVCPGEVATPILLQRPVVPSADEQSRMLQEADLGEAIRWIATQPAHVCINELVISPVQNRLYVGGGELGGPR